MFAYCDIKEAVITGMTSCERGQKRKGKNNNFSNEQGLMVQSFVPVFKDSVNADKPDVQGMIVLLKMATMEEQAHQ